MSDETPQHSQPTSNGTSHSDQHAQANHRLPVRIFGIVLAVLWNLLVWRFLYKHVATDTRLAEIKVPIMSDTMILSSTVLLLAGILTLVAVIVGAKLFQWIWRPTKPTVLRTLLHMLAAYSVAANVVLLAYCVYPAVERFPDYVANWF